MLKIPENIQIIIKSIVPLVIIVILFVILGQIGFGKISAIRTQISGAESDQSVLTQKLNLLRTVSVSGAQNSNIATNSLPDSNASLSVISQLKTLAVNSGLIVTSIKSGTVDSDTDNINDMDIDIGVTGNSINQIESFLSGISTFAPITTLDSVKLSGSTGLISGDIFAKSYWSPFPTELPATIEEFSDLTPQDKQTLQNLSNLTQPIFLSLPPANTTNVKANPFSQ